MSLLLGLFTPAQAKPVQVSNFSTYSLADWQQKQFAGQTNYQIITLDQQATLQARSKAAASSLYKTQSIDLQKTPYLNWSWRIEKKLAIANEKIKSGDDFAARIYLIIKGKWAFWQTKALNYVWSSQAATANAWPNPFAGHHVMMLAIRAKQDKTGQWYQEKRNVRKDLQRYFGEDIHMIDGIAIMTDTDNTQGTALSYYRNIYFSEQ